MTAKKEGSKFEEDFKKSCEIQGLDITRFNDGSAGNFIGGDIEKEGLRFTPANICDFVVFNGKLLLYCELKTTASTSINFGEMREKLKDKKSKVKTGMIKYKQLIGLTEKDLRENKNVKNIAAGFLINFRKLERTYFINATVLKSFIETTEKKSINIEDLEFLKCVKITQIKKIKRYTYNIEALMNYLL